MLFLIENACRAVTQYRPGWPGPPQLFLQSKGASATAQRFFLFFCKLQEEKERRGRRKRNEENEKAKAKREEIQGPIHIDICMINKKV